MTLTDVNLGIKFEYLSNQQEIIYRMNLIFSKWVADSWCTFLMSLIQKTYFLLVQASVNPLPKICKKITLLSSYYSTNLTVPMSHIKKPPYQVSAKSDLGAWKYKLKQTPT